LVHFLATGERNGCRAELVLKSAQLAWKRQGYRALVVTPSRREAETLDSSTGIHAVTARGFLLGLATNRGLMRGYDSMMRKSGKLLLGFRSGKGALNYLLAAAGRWLRLSHKTVVIVANPERLSPAERLSILRQCCARRTRAKVVFMGDYCTSELGPTLLMGPRRSLFEQERDLGLTW
jgi:hypothetical protein